MENQNNFQTELTISESEMSQLADRALILLSFKDTDTQNLRFILNLLGIRTLNEKKAILKEKSSIFFGNNKKKKILAENISLLDKKWEKELITESVLEIIKSSYGKEKEENIDKLFILHSPVLPLNNLKIKMNIQLYNKEFDNSSGKKIRKILFCLLLIAT